MLLKSIFRKGLPEIQMPCTEAARKGIHRIMDVLDWAADKGRISDSDCEDYMILLSAYRPQPKPEWSEEDETGWTNTMIMIKECAANHYTKDSVKLVIDWLEALRQRHTWKPTEEQMRALHDMNLTGNISYAGQGQTLIELYNDLKKRVE